MSNFIIQGTYIVLSLFSITQMTSLDRAFITLPNKCDIQIYYTVGNVDPEFNITRTRVKELVALAASEWNTQAGSEILTEKNNKNTVTISLNYTQSQEMVTRIYANKTSLSLNDKKQLTNIKLGTYKIVKNNKGLQKKIDIYAYASEKDLYATILHELGHSMGLDHTSNKKAVMYESTNDLFNQPNKLHQEDIRMLKNKCGNQA